MEKRKIRIFIILLSAVVLGCLIGFIFRNDIIKAASPETYLKLAIANTAKNVYPSSKQNTPPNEQNLSLKINKIDGNLGLTYNDALERVTLNLLTQTDAAQKKMNMNFSMVSDKFEFKDNELYVSPDIVAIKSPYFYSEHEYISVDPSAFREEFLKIIDKLTKNMTFSNSGKTETSLNKQTVTLDKMSYTVSKEKANEIFQDCINIMKNKAEGNFDFLEKVNFTDDLSANFYINKKQQVVKIEIDEFQISVYSDKYEQDLTASFGFYAEFFGDKSLADGLNLSINAKSGTDNFTVAFSRKSNSDKNILSDNNIIFFKSGNIIMSKLTWDNRFELKNETGDNFKTNIAFNIGFDKISADLAGNLTDSKINSIETPDTSDNINLFEILK